MESRRARDRSGEYTPSPGPAGLSGPAQHGLGLAFGDECARLLADTYLPRLRRAVGVLPETDLWWRPHEGSTSTGNLLLHLEGNLRQWIVCGLGGAPDLRERAAEFGARGGDSAAVLLAALQATIEAAAVVLRARDPAGWLEPVTIQGFETTPLQAALHVVEHCSWHTGQITWIAKARGGAGHGLAFYDEARLNTPPRA
ncbi:MAG: DinB family protein [Planctomycetota bacterium]